MRMARAFASLADLAPTLRERELRVLIALNHKWGGSEHQSGRILAREIADITELSRSNGRLALAELSARNALATRQGTATEPAAHALTFIRATQKRPPPYTERTSAPASIDSIKSDTIIDRLLTANPKHHSPSEIEEARRWIHGYQCKFGKEANARIPDDKLLAQLLTVAPISQIIRLIQDLMAERKEPGYQYSWAS